MSSHVLLFRARLAPTSGWEHFLHVYFTHELNCMDLWGNLVPRSCPSRRVIYCQAGKYCSSHPRRALFSELKHIASYWAPAFGDERKSLKRFQPNPWGGEQIFQLQDSRWRKCAPTCLQSSAAAVRRLPLPWTHRRLEAVRSPPDSLLRHPQTPPRALITVSHRQRRELSAGVARGPRLASRIQCRWAFFINVKKTSGCLSIWCFEKNDSHPFLPPKPYWETWLQRHGHEFPGRCCERSSILLPLPVCPPLQTQPLFCVLCRVLLGHTVHSDGSLS